MFFYFERIITNDLFWTLKVKKIVNDSIKGRFRLVSGVFIRCAY